MTTTLPRHGPALSPLTLYFQQLKETPLLSAEQERELACRNAAQSPAFAFPGAPAGTPLRRGRSALTTSPVPRIVPPPAPPRAGPSGTRRRPTYWPAAPPGFPSRGGRPFLRAAPAHEMLHPAGLPGR
jgi:hypothetical protein